MLVEDFVALVEDFEGFKLVKVVLSTVVFEDDSNEVLDVEVDLLDDKEGLEVDRKLELVLDVDFFDLLRTRDFSIPIFIEVVGRPNVEV